jgi:hypothetical protein
MTYVWVAVGVVLGGCSQRPHMAPFAMPKHVEDVRARLLVYIPEGRDIEGAREWMREHGFSCDAPMESATDSRAHVCRASSAPPDAGYRNWNIVLFERGGRLADVQAHE